MSKQKMKSVKALTKVAEKLRMAGVDNEDIAEAFLEVAVKEAAKISQLLDIGVWLASAGSQVANLDKRVADLNKKQETVH